MKALAAEISAIIDGINLKSGNAQGSKFFFNLSIILERKKLKLVPSSVCGRSKSIFDDLT